MRKGILALPAGFAAAFAIAGIPASAADAPIVAQASSWNPATTSIAVGDSVTWSNPNGGFHNVCVYLPGSPGTTCDEFRNGDAAADWSSYVNSHTFATAGVYKFFCQVHGSNSGTGMSGSVTVGGSSTGTNTGTGTGTGTSTTPPPDTQPTDTITVPTNTDTTPAADTTAPQFIGTLKRKASRTALKLQLGSSEDGKLEATVTRRAPGARSFTRIGQASLNVEEGRNTVTLPRKAAGSLRKGAYRVKLVLIDAAGNRSRAKTLAFKLV